MVTSESEIPYTGAGVMVQETDALAAGSDGPSSSPRTPTVERVNFHRKSIELHRCTVA